MESSWRRAWRDTEHFRHTARSFWGLEIVGAAIMGLGGGFVGFLQLPINATPIQNFLYPAIGGVVGVVPGLAITFLGIYMWNLFRAPIYIKFEGERVPRLIVENDTSVCNHKLGYSWRLKIRNDGIDVAENCQGQLVDIVDEVPTPNWGWARWPKNENLNWADGNRTLSIQSKQTKELEILYGAGYRQYLYLAYARDEAFRQEYAPKSLNSNIVLIIMITLDGKSPIYATCLFHKYCDSFNNLELKAVTSEYPDITLYQQPSSDKEGSQS